MPKVFIFKNNQKIQIDFPINSLILNNLRENGLSPVTPCNGKGTCGKCKVLIKNGLNAPSTQEIKLISRTELDMGIRLSCQTVVTDGMEVYLSQEAEDANIMTDSTVQLSRIDPMVEKKHIELSPPTLEDQMPDDTRLLSGLHSINESLSMEQIIHLSDILRKDSFKVTTTHVLGKLTDIESGHTNNTLLGVAIDIGTTTLAAYLFDLKLGTQLSVASMLNPQKKFGADVISRIDYASSNPKQGEEMKNILISSLNDLLESLLDKQGFDRHSIYLVTLAGNTPMLHLALGLPSRHIAVAPFIPVTTGMLVLKPEEIGINIHKSGRIIVLSSISAYVGADTVAAILSTRLHQREGISILVDIGTNGEIVLGNNQFMLSCSTAAGSAFEGSNIRCGMGCVKGAISEIKPGMPLKIKTIGEVKPSGLCGSGIVDALSILLKTGVVDETGRIADFNELSKGCPFSPDKIIDVNGQPAFELVSAKETAQGEAIVITQKDIREIQNAKAAIAAGIRVLLQEAGIGYSEVDTVYLAGGFGSFLNIDSAVTIGLLPRELANKIEVVGNAAGAGAVHALLSKVKLLEAKDISQKVRYLELSSKPAFVQEYANQMFFDL